MGSKSTTSPLATPLLPLPSQAPSSSSVLHCLVWLLYDAAGSSPAVGEGPQSIRCCHSRAEPNAALGSDGTARSSSNLIGAVLTRISLAVTRRNSAGANRAIGPVHQGLGTSLSDRSEFQSSIQDLIPPCETSQGFCRFWKPFPAARRQFTAGGPNAVGLTVQRRSRDN